jgi:hypothetical protein
MKITLIVLVCLAVVLGAVSYFAVFSGTQVIEPIGNSGSQNSSTPTLVLTTPTSSTSTANLASGTTPIVASGGNGTYATVFSAPYPVTWQEGGTQLSVTSASLQGNNLTLTVNLQLGSESQCVPINIRIITDESGDMAAPNIPSTANFPLGSGSDCTGTGNAMYPGQAVTFTVDPSAMPFLLTTGAPGNIFFEVSTTTGNGLQVVVPQASG